MQPAPFRAVSIVLFVAASTYNPAFAENPPLGGAPSLLEAIRSANQGRGAAVPPPFGGAKADTPASADASKPAEPQKPTPTPVTGSPQSAASTAPVNATADPATSSANNADSWKPEPIRVRSEVSIKQPRLNGGNGVTLRFDNADIYEVIQTVMGEILGLNYIVDPGVTGKINISGITPVNAEDLFGVFQSVLALNNVSIIREGNLYKVVRDSLAPRDAISGSAVGDNGAMVQIFAPKFVQPSALIGVLKNFIGPQAGIVNDATNHYLIVSDRARNVKKIAELIESLDVDYLERVQIEIVPIENGDPTELAKEMETLFKSSQLYNWPGTEPNKVFFMPIKRMNSILIGASTKQVMDMAKRRIKEVDALPKEGLSSRINIYSVKNSSADYLAGLISQIYGGAAAPSSSSSSAATTQQGATRVVQKGPTGSSTASGSGLAGEVQIIPNEKSNSLIIKANRQDYLQVLKLLDQLDTLPRQVLIQANVIEVTLTGSNSLGLEWSLLNERASINSNNYTATTKFTSGVDKATNGLLYTLFDGPSTAIATIQAAATGNDVRVLSSPRILASDGKEAKIEIGQEVPVTTQQISNVATGTAANPGTTLSSTVTYRTVGLILKVKPSINESGKVNLELSQEVSQVIDSKSSQGTTTPSFSTRKIQTEITIQEGKTLTIGGLISDQGTMTDVGIPYLKDVPVFGNLFGSTTKKRDRTELLLTITPYVLRNQDDADRINRQLDDAMEEIRTFTQKITPNKLDLAKKPPAPAPMPPITSDN